MSGKEDQRGDRIEVSGSGAAASHGGVAAGAGGVAVGRDVYGNITVIVHGENVRDKEVAYLDGLLARYEYWRDHYTPLAGIAEVRAAVKDGPRLDLPMPFIPPEFEKLVEHGYGEREVRRVAVDDLRAALAEHRRIILLGEPGSGKTTTLWRLAYDYATAARDDGQAPLPVLVPLGGYTDDSPFDAYLARYLGPLAAHLETYRASRRLILLLDGLNEMPRAGYDERVGRIREVLDRQPGDVVVVTCRALDYVVKLEGLQKVEVSPLDEERIRTFLHNYLGETAGERLFWIMAGGDEVRELWHSWQWASGTWVEFWTAEKMPQNVYSKTMGFQDQLWERLREEPPPLLALGRNPYLLLMTAQVYAAAGGELPANRAQLFAAFVDTLLGREKKRNPEQWIEAEVQKDGLAALAYVMQVERGRGTTVEREWAVARLRRAVPGCDAERLLYLTTSATLLDADEATVRFYHQLLQEYFAAREMGRRVEAGEALDRYWPLERWWEPSGWEETTILLAGMEPDASALLEDLAAVNPVVAARCLVEGGAQEVSETAQHGAVLALVNCLDDERMAPGARAQAGQLLARLGDPRPGVGLREDGLPDVVWCEVLAGPFVMGTREQDIPALLKKYGGDREWYEWETPQHKLNLPAYSIGKYPVTNAQYAAFVQDGGYTEKWRRCWTRTGWEWRVDRTGPRTYGGVFDLPNHPVVGVSWYEAVAFCRWLTERLRETGEIGLDQEVTLPTEAQWEKAARGGDSRIFPWGDEFDAAKCNVDETGIGTTSAVGTFPAGVLPYGVLDLSGNVWEWCCTKWRDSYKGPADESLEGDALRVLRGGSWYYSPDIARCAGRGWCLPCDSYRSVGFRLVSPVSSGY